MRRKPKAKDIERLARAATRARRHAYAPYSGFMVGAAVLTSSGKVIPGCNVENSSYGLTMCAERVALYTAVSSGQQDVTAIAVASGMDEFLPPCGACRQVISDLAGDVPVILVDGRGRRRTTSLRALLPKAFGPSYLKH